MHGCILSLVLAAVAAAAILSAAAGSIDADAGEPARCILKMTGGSLGAPTINITCSGSTIKVFINPATAPKNLALQGVVLDKQPDCLSKLGVKSCIVALCSGDTPIVLVQGSQLAAVEAEMARLCIGGSANVSMDGMVVANNSWPAVTASDYSLAAVRVTGNSRIAITNCMFHNNAVALYVVGKPKLTVSNSTFSDNYYVRESYGGGAAIYAEAADTFEISNSTFSNNSATGVASGGGAIYTSAKLVLKMSHFTRNWVVGAMAGGGALWVDGAVHVWAYNTSFVDNFVEGDASEGGAIYGRQSTFVSLNGGSLLRNVARGERARGGAISTNRSASVRLQGVAVQGNVVVGPFGQGGGIFTNAGGTLFVGGGCTILGNTAEFGGAVAILDADVAIVNTTVTNNTATQYDGGALYGVSTGKTTLRIIQSTFSSNRAFFDGGAVFARIASRHNAKDEMHAGDGVQLQVHLSGALLVSNSAERGYGGAVNVDGGQLVIANATKFRQNSAAADGGGFAIYAAASHSLRKAHANLQQGCVERWEPGMAVLNMSQSDAAFEGNSASRSGGAGFVAEHVLCNTTAVLTVRDASAAPNTAASSRLIQAPGRCDAGFYWTSAGVCAQCPYGTYRLLNATHTDASACQLCPNGAGYHCPGGDTVRPLPDYWMADYTRAEYAFELNALAPPVHWCPGYKACPGCSFKCSPGYRGRLCSECEAGYGSPTPFRCTPCGNTASYLAVSTLTTVVLVYVLWVAAWCSKPNGFFSIGDVLKQVVWFCQVLVIVGRSSQFAWAPFAQTFFSWLGIGFAQGELGSVPAIQCLAGEAMTAVLPWGLWRGILSVFVFPVSWISLLLLVHLSLVGMLSLCGVTPATRKYKEARGVPGKLRYVCMMLIVAVRRSVGRWCELRDRLIMLFYVALAYFYPVLLRVSLSSFVCIEVEGQQLWSVDMSLTCWTGQHLAWVIGIGMVLGFCLVFAVPVLYNAAWLASPDQATSTARHSPAPEIETQKMMSSQPSLQPRLQPQPSGDAWVFSGVQRLQQYLHGAYRERCKAWEGLLQIRLVFLVMISVASPSMGPYYTLLAYCGVLGAFMVWHSMQKPYRDLGLQQLQTLAYLVLLLNVVLAIVVVTADTRPGPRSAHGQKVSLDLSLQAAADDQGHCPDQIGTNSSTSRTIVAASVAMVVFNTLFGVVACLISYSLLTRSWRVTAPACSSGCNCSKHQLLQLATDGAPVWMLGLGSNKSSRLGIPFVHAGLWTSEGEAERVAKLHPRVAQHGWLVTSVMVWGVWLKGLFSCQYLRWWPAEVQALLPAQAQEQQDGQQQVSEAAAAHHQQRQEQQQQSRAQAAAEQTRCVHGTAGKSSSACGRCKQQLQQCHDTGGAIKAGD